MAFLPRICALFCCVTLYSLAAMGEDTITKQIMPPQKGRLSTPEDRDKFAREHPRPPTSGQDTIPFRPTEGAEKYKAEQEAAQAVWDARLRSKSKETRLDTLNKNKKSKMYKQQPKDCAAAANEKSEASTPLTKECAEAANVLMRQKP